VAEIVGTAYVRVRAITTQLGSDIKDGLDKGMADYDAEGAGSDIGKRISAGAGKAIADDDSISTSISTQIGDNEKKIDNDSNVVGNTISKGVAKGFNDNEKKGKGLAGSLSKTLKSISLPGKLVGGLFAGLFAVPAVGGAVKLIEGYIVTLVGQIGWLVTAAAGGGAALGAMFGAAALAAVPLMLAFKAQTPMLEHFQKMTQDVGKAWEEVGKATQKTLLPALEESLTLITKKLIPGFKFFGGIVGEAVGDVAKFAAGLITSERNALPFFNIFVGSEDIIRKLGGALALVIDAFIPFLSAAMPMARDLADHIARFAFHINEAIRAGADSGALGSTLQIWYDRAKQVAGILGDVFMALWNIVSIGADVTAPMFDSMAGIAQKMRDFTESEAGAGKIRDIFVEMKPIADELNKLIADIVKWLITPVMGDSSNVVAFLESIRTVFLPALQELSAAMTDNMADSMTTFFTALIDFLSEAANVGALGVLLSSLTTMLTILTELFQIPGFGQFVGMMFSLIAVFEALVWIAKPFVKAFGFLSTTFSVLGKVVAFLWPLLQGAFYLLSALTGLAAGPLIAVIAAVVAAIVGLILIFFHWEKVLGFLDMVWDAIYGFVVGLPEMLGGAASAVWGWLQEAVPIALDWIGRLITGIGTWLLGLPGKILGWIGGAAQALWGWISTALPVILGWLGKIFIALMTWAISLPGKIIGWLLNAAGALVGWIADAIPQILYWLGYALGFIIGWAIRLPVELVALLVNAGSALWGWISEALPQVIGWLLNLGLTIITWIQDFITGLPSLFLDGIKALWGWISEAVPKALEWLGNLASDIWGWISGFLIELPGRIAGAAGAILSWLTSAITQLPGKLAEWAQKIWDWVTGFIAELPGKFTGAMDAIFGVGEDIIRELWEGIKSMAGWIASKIGGFVKDAVSGLAGGIWDGITSVLPGGDDKKGKSGKGGGMISISPGLPSLFDTRLFGAASIPLPTMNAALAQGLVTTAATLSVVDQSSRNGQDNSAALGAGGINILVKIGERDITDIVDTQIDSSNMSLAQSVYRRGRRVVQ
jgi:hypothetical protein